MNLDWIRDLLTFALPGGFLGSVVTWLVNSRYRYNDGLQKMQASVEMLSQKYNEVLQENVRLKSDNAKLLANQEIMKLKIDLMNNKIDELTQQLNISKK